MSSYIFTITAGRTGTAWLANFIRDNLKIPSIHEPLEIDDFGVQMPDIKTMRMFNERGLNDFVIDFWKRKFDCLKSYDTYAESNHTLAKCGLLEFAADYRKQDKFTFICIRRNRVKQCISYITRGDFQNITIDWQWYLNIRYKRKIVDPTPLLRFGLGTIIWYIFEIEARQEYYKILYGKQFNFVDTTLEEMTQPAGAKTLLEALGSHDEPKLNEKVNENRILTNPDMPQQLENIIRNAEETIGNISFDPKQAAATFIEHGHKLG